MIALRKKILVGMTGIALAPLIMTGCSSSNKSSDNNSTTTENYTINTSGGLGGANTGSGGSGNDVQLYKQSGTGDAEIRTSGSADASFTASTPDGNLGSNPLNITTDTSIAVVTDEPAAGTPYLVANSSTLRISDGNGTLNDENAVTGISVASGATLTLSLNYNTATRSYIYFNGDVVNNGSITTEDASATSRGNLYFSMSSYIGSTGSAINTAGTGDGQNGGYVAINANYSIYNHSNILTRGNDSTASNAGDGGYVSLNANYIVQNTGDISSRGGDAASGNAGSGGYINLHGGYGNCFNSGDLTSIGGNGEFGGNGNYVSLEANPGKLLNSGNIDTHGGNSTNSNGATAGAISMNASGGQLVNSGNLTASGGDSTESASNGGNGNQISLYIGTGGIDSTRPAGDMMVSGNMDNSGGDAVASGSGNGGNGASITASIESNGYPSNASIMLLGYTDIDTSGGDGNYGGVAGNFGIQNDYIPANSTYLPGGNVVNEANVNAHGGNVVATAVTTPANGGNGGNYNLETDYNYGYLVPELELATNSGNIDLSGGDSLESTSNNSGRSGSFWLWGYNGATNSGTVTANGGNDAGTDGGTTGYGNYASDVQMFAELGEVNNSGNLINNGGNGEYRGGYTNGISLYGATVSNTGNLTSNGGNADANLASSRGGNGGYIELYSPEGVTGVSNSGTVSHLDGTGTITYEVGMFISGGVCISGPCNGVF